MRYGEKVDEFRLKGKTSTRGVVPPLPWAVTVPRQWMRGRHTVTASATTVVWNQSSLMIAAASMPSSEACRCPSAEAAVQSISALH